jgi:hypothetical protein
MEGFLLGLSTGTYCLTACAPIALPLFAGEDPDARRNAGMLALFLSGRLAAYLAVGFLLGMIGAYAAGFVEPAFMHAALRVSAAISGLLLLLAAFARNPGSLKLCELARSLFKPGAGAFVAGLATGLSLCPPFVAAAARVFSGGADSGIGGALFFLSFFLGTAVYFLPLLGVPFVTKRLPMVKTVARMTMFLLGAYYLLVIGALGAS